MCIFKGRRSKFWGIAAYLGRIINIRIEILLFRTYWPPRLSRQIIVLTKGERHWHVRWIIHTHSMPFQRSPRSSAWAWLCQCTPSTWRLLPVSRIHREEKKSLIMFVDLRLPLNIYLFSQSTGRFKFELGEVKGHRDIPQLCCGEPSDLGKRELGQVKCCCAVCWLRQIEAWLNSIKLIPIWEICLTKPWKRPRTCVHWFCCWTLLGFDEKAASTFRWKGFTSSILKRAD